MAVADCSRGQLATAMIGSTSSGTFTERTDRIVAAASGLGVDEGDTAVGHTTAADRDASGERPGASAGAAPDDDVRPGPVPGTGARGGVARLVVEAISLGRLDRLSLEVAAGEILGIAGVDGNGQADLEAVLCGRSAPDGGSVSIGGEPLPAGDPAGRAAAGVAYVPSDRYRFGLVRPMDLAENLELGRTRRVRRSRRARHRAAAERLDDWQVRSAGPGARASTLSGGNAQKLVLARELGGDPEVIVACYPTRGLDPGAAATVAERLVERAAGGAAILWIGAELDELFAVSDRIVVLADGRVAGEFGPPFDRAAIGLAMTDESSPVAHAEAVAS